MAILINRSIFSRCVDGDRTIPAKPLKSLKNSFLSLDNLEARLEALHTIEHSRGRTACMILRGTEPRLHTLSNGKTSWKIASAIDVSPIRSRIPV